MMPFAFVLLGIEGVPGGGSFAGASGGQIEWTGLPLVRATCSCLG